MSLWPTVLIACGLAYVLKFAGYIVPHRVLEAPRVRRVTALLPVALLAALVGVQTFVGSGDDGSSLVLDSRAIAVAVAIGALLLRAPFILVVIIGAATAAGLRLLGLP
ncbi:branched-subunit amino acid transport protein [Kineosphaera limosa]|uniref:Branched-chain amino acid transporter AzlD n=1 Tax=Kineosphaera limosa NBRC 100340 TaxID=1184609 RepID=K6W516_9MICO|nr:AzlD domain-containing protein [Kineosphaera limosa]NYE02825.1 branched-subunit amino acid transport protein [Kineosphaera limosa]GAB94255.1 hypothetical protein KILIM_004_00440 [Kineosphaera limosa NBRC 100340]